MTAWRSGRELGVPAACARRGRPPTFFLTSGSWWLRRRLPRRLRSLASLSFSAAVPVHSVPASPRAPGPPPRGPVLEELFLALPVGPGGEVRSRLSPPLADVTLRRFLTQPKPGHPLLLLSVWFVVLLASGGI